MAPTHPTTPHTPSLKRAYIAWLTCALFFFYQYILRVAPGVMIDQLRMDFHLTAAEFSTFGAFYLYAYSALQIPLGALVDRFGIRVLILISIALCMGGTFWFAASTSLLPAQLSRILVGIGSATAFMCSVKIAADYFPTGKRGLLMGFTLTLGTVGALTAGKPLVLLLEVVGWRDTLNFTAIIAAPLLLLAVFFLPSKPKTATHTTRSWTEFFSQIRSILQNRMIFLYTLLAVGLYTPLSALADLWGTTFLMQKYLLSHADAAHTSMMMYGGMALGSLIMPWYFEKRNQIEKGVQMCGLGLLLLMTMILYGPTTSLAMTTLLLLALGLFCGGEMLCFTGIVHYTTPQTSGLTLGVANTFNMLGGALLQQLIGLGLDWQWDGVLSEHNIRQYSTEQFVMALSCLVVIIALCVGLSFSLKKTPKKRP